VTNILGRQAGVSPDVLKTILAGSGKSAKANITRRTPQIAESHRGGRAMDGRGRGHTRNA
jgi:hypothetical protein